MPRCLSAGWAVVATLACCCHLPAEQGPESEEPRQLVNLRAFARLYGVVRWFHPSDEAAAIDWNRYAVLGATRARSAATTEQLAATLIDLVIPIAPTVRIVRPGQTASPPPTVSGDATWWQHVGPGIGGSAPPYISKRRGKPAPVQASGSGGFGTLTRSIDAKPHRGKPIRLRAKLRAADGGSAHLWIRVDRPNAQVGFFENMMDRPVASNAWSEVEIAGEVAGDAVSIVFGGLMTGTGTTWFDEFTIDVGGTSVPFENAGFEDGLAGWYGSLKSKEPGAYLAAVTTNGASGTRSATLSPPAPLPPVVIEPFDHRPEPGEVADVDLGDGLRARVPLIVGIAGGATIPSGERRTTAAALATVPDPAATSFDPAVGFADVIVTWNIFAHFYPYLDVIGENWDRVLDDALDDTLDDRTAEDSAATLERLVARARDGHGRVMRPSGERKGTLPLRVAWIENRVVVVASGNAAIRRGDVIEAIDGLAASNVVERAMERISGSPQWSRGVATDRLSFGPLGRSVALRLTRGGDPVDATLSYGTAPPPSPPVPPMIGELEPGYWYVDLDRAPMNDITAALESLAKARGVVFDLRGYPRGNSSVLSNVIRKPDVATWMLTAMMVRPFQRGALDWSGATWSLEPAEPHLANVAFVTGPGAISYAESVLGYVEYEGLPIVGEPSAGTNGNVRTVDLPSGARFAFTGMRVVRHDGTQHHLIGVKPTVPVSQTIAGIIAGRDDVLELALAVVKQNAPR